MNMFQDDMMEVDFPTYTPTRSKPIKRKWREIEAIKDKQRLRKELLDMDPCLDDDDLEL